MPWHAAREESVSVCLGLCKRLRASETAAGDRLLLAHQTPVLHGMSDKCEGEAARVGAANGDFSREKSGSEQGLRIHGTAGV